MARHHSDGMEQENAPGAIGEHVASDLLGRSAGSEELDFRG